MHDQTDANILGVKRIMIPTDFSPPADRALLYAIRYAETTGSEMLVLHVEHHGSAPWGTPAKEYLHCKERAHQQMRERLDALIARFSRNPEKPLPFHYRLIIVGGDAAQEIIKSALDHSIDMIFIPTHGYRGMKRIFLGGTAQKVVRYAACPVVVVREKDQDLITPPKEAEPAGNQGCP
ncbi:MAG: hypothetical protein JWO82_2964 [Akkermansiaceae bacterium]|nr:hypothetical protein [Akkermansiaceae bacterium]